MSSKIILNLLNILLAAQTFSYPFYNSFEKNRNILEKVFQLLEISPRSPDEPSSCLQLIYPRDTIYSDIFLGLTLSLMIQESQPVLNFGNIEDLLTFIEKSSSTTLHWNTQKTKSLLYFATNTVTENLLNKISKINGPTRRGNVVFISSKTLFLSTLFEDPSVRSLKQKSGFSLQNNMVLIESEIPTGKMVLTSNIPTRPKNFINLRNRHIRISGSKMPPYCDVRTENGKKKFSGANFAIIDYSSKKYNFTYDLEAPKGKSPGTKLKNGTWTGMLADVYNGKADVTIVNAYNVERFHVIDFTTSFTITNLVYVTSHPRKQISLAAIIYP
ncbi:unnamed protein product, partial [Allacma fusca]